MSKKFNEYKVCGDYSIIYVKRKDKTIEVVVDTDDLKKVILVGSWHAIEDKTLQETGYYICNRYNNKSRGAGCIKLHRFIMNCPNGMCVDHINHNTLDNRKSNLRICTHFENQQNLRSKKTELTGVYKSNKYKKEKWVANITKDKNRITKYFNTKEEAINWRLDKMKELYGLEVMPR